MEEIEALKKEISTLAAETFALQVLLVNIVSSIGNSLPQLKPALLSAFDEASDLAERYSIAKGGQAAHIPKALDVIEELRMSLAGKSKPKNAV